MSVPVGREKIWSAFFALLSPGLLATTGGPFQTVTRRAKPFEQVAPGQMPYLAVLQRHETANGERRGIPTIWTLRAELYIYAKNEIGQVAPDSGGGQVLNPLIDAVEEALAPLAVQGNVQSLGGIVSRAFIDGEVEVYEGNINTVAVAIVPVRIVANA